MSNSPAERRPDAALTTLLTILLTTLAVALGLLAGGAPAQAAGIASGQPTSAAPAQPTSAAASQPTPDLRQPFTREPVRRGDVDADPYDIEHVYEVQIRLRRLGFLHTTPTGSFGPRTEEAVRSFQQSRGLRVTGRVDARTWVPLIRRSTWGKKQVPPQCHERGWHLCYDRQRHQASLFKNGRLHNSWLVRGGAYDVQTRPGDFEVQWRSKDHVSRAFDAPMPFAQFFSGGQALHGSRLMMDPFEGHSHGCVNFWVEDARQLWRLTYDKRLFVHVYGEWD